MGCWDGWGGGIALAPRLVEHCSPERNRRCMTGKVHLICESVATNVRTCLQPQIRRWASSHKSRLWPPLTLAYRYAGSQIRRLTVTGEGENQYSWDPLIWERLRGCGGIIRGTPGNGVSLLPNVRFIDSRRSQPKFIGASINSSNGGKESLVMKPM